jgi:hypothetical protein
MCFTGYATLSKLGLNKCGYRLLRSKRASQLVFVFGSDKLEEELIWLTPALADTLQLKFKHRESVKVERIQLNLGDGKNGMP